MVWQLVSDPIVREYLGGPIERENFEALFASYLTDDDECWHWAIRVGERRGFGGLISLTPHHDSDEYEISYQLVPSYWCQGVAAETVNALLEFAFDDLELPRLVAETQAANTPSRKLLERLGFVVEKELMRYGERQLLYAIKARPSRDGFRE